MLRIWRHELGRRFPCSKALYFQSRSYLKRDGWKPPEILYHKPADDEIPTLPMSQLFKEQDLIAFQLDKQHYDKRSFDKIITSRRKQGDVVLVPQNQADLPPRAMKDSYMSRIIRLSSDENIRSEYMNYTGTTIRLGKLLANMDIFGGATGYQHTHYPDIERKKMAYAVATVMVEDIIVNDSDRILVDADIRITGHVVWTGQSSLEIAVLCDQQISNGTWNPICQGYYTYACRDMIALANGNKSAVNPLKIEPQMESYHKKAEIRRQRRQERRNQLSNEIVMSAAENEEIQKILPSRNKYSIGQLGHIAPKLKPNTIFMKDSKLISNIIPHPNNRNPFHQVFGGFLIQKAEELACACARLFGKCPITDVPVLLCANASYLTPADLGEIFRYQAMVTYVYKMYYLVTVSGERTEIEQKRINTSAVFHFIYASNDSMSLPQVIPETYTEALLFVNAKRYFEERRNFGHLPGLEPIPPK